MTRKSVTKDYVAGSGIAVTLQELIQLRAKAWHQQPIRIKKRLSMSGQLLTPIRGRGIEFDATREYQAGDDIRSMAWRVTARCLKPHIKVYREEKERPVWLAMDLSPSLYFGTRCMFKSVKSIMQATLTGWSTLRKRERIGAIISTAQSQQLFQPKADEKTYLAILKSFADASRLQPAFKEENNLKNLLKTLQQHARTGDLIHLYSDFNPFDDETKKILIHLAQRAQVMLNFIYDPFEAMPPPPYVYLLTNGHVKMRFNMENHRNRDQYLQNFQVKVRQLETFARDYQMTLHLHRTDSDRG